MKAISICECIGLILKQLMLPMGMVTDMPVFLPTITQAQPVMVALLLNSINA